MMHHRRLLIAVATLATLSFTVSGGLGIQNTKASGGGKRSFNLASLSGSYASSGRADGATSRSVGVIEFDGRGGATRFVRINSPDGNGGRALIDLTSVGTYSVDADGMGVMELTNYLPSGATSNVSFDFVIAKSERGGNRGAIRALDITIIQREPGITASLIEDYLTYREGL
jgi:hypothetical protein